jgi:hypothetical protein
LSRLWAAADETTAIDASPTAVASVAQQTRVCVPINSSILTFLPRSHAKGKLFTIEPQTDRDVKNDDGVSLSARIDRPAEARGENWRRGMDMTQEWLEPWYRLDNDGQRLSLEQELERELSERHVLWKEAVTTIARRADQDDVLVRMPDGRVAEVHLTWSRRTERSTLAKNANLRHHR